MSFRSSFSSSGRTGSMLTALNSIEALITLTNTYVDGVEALLSSLDTDTSSIETLLTQISGYVDGLETLITASNVSLDNIDSNTDDLETLVTSTNTALSAINSLITATNAELVTLNAHAVGQTALLTAGNVSTAALVAHLTSLFDTVSHRGYVALADYIGELGTTAFSADNLNIAGTRSILTASRLMAVNSSGNLDRLTVDSNKNLNVSVFQNSTEPDEVLKFQLVDTTPTNEMAVNGSVTPVTYKYTVPANYRLYLYRSLFTLEDGSAAFAPVDFGALGSTLANGVQIKAGGTTLYTIKSNREIAQLCYDIDNQWKAAGDYKVRWTHSKDHGTPIQLEATETFEVVINDDLTGLDSFQWMIAGKLVSV